MRRTAETVPFYLFAAGASLIGVPTYRETLTTEIACCCGHPRFPFPLIVLSSRPRHEPGEEETSPGAALRPPVQRPHRRTAVVQIQGFSSVTFFNALHRQ